MGVGATNIAANVESKPVSLEHQKPAIGKTHEVQRMPNFNMTDRGKKLPKFETLAVDEKAFFKKW